MKHFKIAAILLISLLAAMNLVGSQIRLRNKSELPGPHSRDPPSP